MSVGKMTEQIDVTPDHKITKRIIKEGSGRMPKNGEKVGIHDIGSLSDGTVFDNSHDKGKKFKFTLGEDVIDGLSLAVASMKEGEKSVFSIHYDYGYGSEGRPPTIPPCATLTFEIELVWIYEKFHNSYDACARANQLKEEATKLFREGKFAEASAMYKKALSPLKDWVSDNATELRLVLHRNMAISYSKIQDWPRVLHHADEVLYRKKYDPKALLRKGEALLELGRLGEAREVITTGYESTQGSAPFAELRKRLAAAERPDQQRQNQLFAKMFAK